mmetsp:Transcript_4279/g.9224  ORF Transcript_4279/g.9224 Transcript_4279/m.9224 type:complete len:204 (+) Transcript_4279:216-827(+)
MRFSSCFCLRRTARTFSFSAARASRCSSVRSLSGFHFLGGPFVSPSPGSSALSIFSMDSRVSISIAMNSSSSSRIADSSSSSKPACCADSHNPSMRLCAISLRALRMRSSISFTSFSPGSPTPTRVIFLSCSLEGGFFFLSFGMRGGGKGLSPFFMPGCGGGGNGLSGPPNFLRNSLCSSWSFFISSFIASFSACAASLVRSS